MKKLLVPILFILLSLSSNAQQTEWLFGIKNKDSCRMLADDLITNFKGKFKFKSQSDIDTQYGLFYEALYQSDSLKDVMGKPIIRNVLLRKYNIGENKALEIAGTPTYYLSTYEGSFLELFPIWNKYIDSSAVKEEIASKGFIVKDFKNPNPTGKKALHCIFRKKNFSNEVWELVFQ